MIKWVILLVVSAVLWISEYRKELHEINSEYVQLESEHVPKWNKFRKDGGNEKKSAEE